MFDSYKTKQTEENQLGFPGLDQVYVEVHLTFNNEHLSYYNSLSKNM
jgi:hypothetical protein